MHGAFMLTVNIGEFVNIVPHISPDKTYGEQLQSGFDRFNLKKVGAFAAVAFSTLDNLQIEIPITGTVQVDQGLQVYFKLNYDILISQDVFAKMPLPDAPGDNVSVAFDCVSIDLQVLTLNSRFE
jgi:hypothetical protein